MTNLETTTKVHSLLIKFKHDELAKKIGITKPTLYARLFNHNWKLGEKSLIEKM